jgi:mannose-6-phosphate isomerase-like protein (cupin superfamily)
MLAGGQTAMKRLHFALALGVGVAVLAPLAGREPLAARIAHSDPGKFRHSPAVHGGAGALDFTALLDAHAVEPNLQFLHRGVIEPKSGIGAHFHNQCEEMFVILDGEAQFTIDGHTSLLKGPAGAPCRMGHSHAIYNPTDQPVQWLNINVSMAKDQYDAFNLNDPRVGVPLDPIPQFISIRLDRELLRPVNAMNGGKGPVQYRRALDSTIFLTSWAYLDHLVLPPAASIGPHLHHEVAEVYYVMKGSGTASVGGGRGADDTAAIKEGDAVPIQLGESHSFENTGSEPLEFMIIGVARDLTKHVDSIDVGAGRGGPRGN